MELSLAFLGSKEIEQLVLADIDELYSSAKLNNLKPLIMLVGPLFMDITSIQSIVYDLEIKNWREELRQNSIIIKNSIYEKKLSLYKHCDENEGLFDIDQERGNIKIFFDPDEPYIALVCAITLKYKKSKSSQKLKDDSPKDDNSPRILRFRDDEILVPIQQLLEDQ